MTHQSIKLKCVRWCFLLATMQMVDLVNAKSPHVVFIMADDMGWNDVSYHGSDQILTPNIDTIAFRSVILQQYYSEAICTPARTALLTGKYPMRLGMHGPPLFNGEDRGIPLTERLLPSYMKELGYTTHLVGKWHVGMSRPEYLPTARGYDSHYGPRGGFVDYYTYNKVETWPNGYSLFGLDLFDDNIPQEDEERYIVDALTDRAVRIIHHHNASQPLFLHLTHTAPHAGNIGGLLQPPLNSTVQNRHIAHSDRRLYAEVVQSLDLSVGKVVKALDAKGILNDTIIIFVSDNGAPTIGKTNNWGVNLPFRGLKETAWEGAVRVPAYIWHSSFKPRIWDGLMHITDWLPTLTTAAGGEFNGKIDGINQWDSIVQDGESSRRDVLLTLEDNDLNRFASYRAGDYKIVIGNVTGMNNDYYGEKFIINKKALPAYYPALKSCEVARVFERMGIVLDYNEVLSMRNATVIKQEDKVKDRTLCVPTPRRGCLFNVRRDPIESHDLWDKEHKVAVTLTKRVLGLWAMQDKRGPTNIQVQADPANFDYVWTPWIHDGSEGNSGTQSNRNSTSESLANCDNKRLLRHLLCKLKVTGHGIN
ncbi:arylsulfatase B-like isoform X2 [Ostrinia nubilalis]|uniref:arylsulfatase B-like isoform X2 n=1 Tax=Ostrinia nubilalis TaxID=29057 RepID=UPI0030826383